MTYKFSERSLKRLEGVHPDLVKVMMASITNSPWDFGISEGLRSPERQRELYKAGKSRTLASRHITGHAIDFAVWVNGNITWDFPKYQEVALHIKKVAKEMGVAITWGGEWRGLVDGPHIELNRKAYP